MIEKLKELARLRAKAEAAVTAKQDAEVTAKATPQWEAYEDAARNARAIEDELDEFETALKVEIKAFTVAKITDEQAARAWL